MVAPAAFGATTADEALLKAYQAFNAGDAISLARYAPALEGSVLEPYGEYWALELRLEDAPDAEVRAFLVKHAGTYLAQALRADWAKQLGKREHWARFERALAPLAARDLELRCYDWAARLARGDKAVAAEAKSIWLEPGDLPAGCQLLADKLAARGAIDAGEVWQRARVLFERGQITAAKSALGYLPRAQAPDELLLAQAATQPQQVLARLPRHFGRRATREVAVLAALRLASSDPRLAAEALEGPVVRRLNASERAYLWSRVALEGARAHDGEALDWYARLGREPLGYDLAAWKARAALRRGDWPTVRDAIDAMSAADSRQPAWIYWYGRALAAQGKREAARAYYQRISGGTDFYGLLATEELGALAAIPAPSFVPSDAQVAAARGIPGLARALELYRLGLRTEATGEWVFAIRGMDDRELLAAAELARRESVYDRAISTANMTVRLHDFRVRYPVPFEGVFGDYARTHGLDEAWVLGLVRQESRFIVDARSDAGARGLMQLMPRTARWVARKIGLVQYEPHDVAEVETNITLGTGYLKMVLEDLGHEVLASAAYNAGPRRARSWRDAKPLEGAIYVETIPFSETRRYVKNVMANAVIYAALLGEPRSSLHARLGVIPAADAGGGEDDMLP
ncbi:MAG TPA: transglycosylase SLT domain-containing protein [Burkholderiales bacterium]|nr:transglycosylase SLT domain-containing protein [Burkholderiales bacterium]